MIVEVDIIHDEKVIEQSGQFMQQPVAQVKSKGSSSLLARNPEVGLGTVERTAIRIAWGED